MIDFIFVSILFCNGEKIGIVSSQRLRLYTGIKSFCRSICLNYTNNKAMRQCGLLLDDNGGVREACVTRPLVRDCVVHVDLRLPLLSYIEFMLEVY